MQACSQAGNKGGQASNGPLSQQKDGSLQSGAFSEAQPLMNGQGDSDRHAEHGAGEGPLQPSRHRSGGDIGVEDGGGGEMSMGDQELLGQQTLDFWLNLCIGHTLIVEQDENGGPSVFQVQHAHSTFAFQLLYHIFTPICTVRYYSISSQQYTPVEEPTCFAIPSVWPAAITDNACMGYCTVFLSAPSMTFQL